MNPILCAIFALLPTIAVSNSSVIAQPVSAGKSEAVERLIDQFQNISQEGVGFNSMATAGGFVAVESVPRFEGGILGTAAPTTPKALARVVALGVKAMPSLLAHLNDRRPTKLTIRHDGGFGGMWLSTELDIQPYDRVPSRELLGLKPVQTGIFANKTIKVYNLKVGDICFAAIGQIVNRSYSPVSYVPSACIEINSSVQSREMCKAIRTEWRGLTVKDHQRSLILDTEKGSGYMQADAGVRLLYYYPKIGKRYVLDVLKRSSSGTEDVNKTEQLIGALDWNHDPDIDNAVDSVLVHISKTLAKLAAQPLSDKNQNDAFEIETCGISCISHLIDHAHTDHCRTFRDLSIRWLNRQPAGYAKEQYLASFKEISRHLDMVKTHNHP